MENLHDIGLDNFLNITTRAQATIAKMDKNETTSN